MTAAGPEQIGVRLAEATDLDELATVLGRAFDDDPVLAYVVSGRPVAPRAAVIFKVFARLHLEERSVYVAVDRPTGRIVGAAIWADPGHWRIPTSAYVRYGWTLGRAVGLGGILRAGRLTALERLHPRTPHHYLAVLGTDPDHRGRGVGVALMQPVLDRCDETATPAYLESSKLDNIAYYARQRFDVTSPYTIRNGPTMYLMWREPQVPDAG